MKIAPHLSRRKFLGLSLVVGATTGIAPISLITLLNHNSGPGLVQEIVENHYGPINDPKFFTDFYHSLQRSSQRIESFHQLLYQNELREKLELYVVEEFASTTNYFEVSAGTSRNFKVIDAVFTTKSAVV